jgi:hypothetical protein
MAYSVPLTAVAGAALTDSQWNASVRDNILVTPAALATAAGKIFVSTAANMIAERTVAHATVATSQTTATTGSWVNLATVGPAVTLTTGTVVLVVISGNLKCSLAGTAVSMSFEVTGASSLAADSTRSLVWTPGVANDVAQFCNYIPVTGLTAGTNTFTAKYATNGGTATFLNRHIMVFPFGG